MKNGHPEPLNEKDVDQLRAMSMARHGLGIYQYTLDGVITYIDRVTLDVFDLSDAYPDPSAVIGKKIRDLIRYTDREGSIRERIQQEGHFYGSTYHYKTLKGDDRWCIHDAYLIQHPKTGEDLVHIVFRDTTELKQAEAARKILEEQLYQSQKLEAIGLLAGGIAHDFNNILQIIIGFGDMALMNAAGGKPVKESLEEIIKAGHRAKTLVSQLLAYSRQQILETRVLNLHTLVNDMLQMLKRVIGETIELRLISVENGLEVKADPGQLGQILTNLCVNARDAMAGSGVITIDIRKEQIEDDHYPGNPWAAPGEYVVLEVADTGCGMSRETQERIFDPFFTTKEVGQGSGLGLSTVYGLVNQHHGFIHVYSEIGKGTTFRIHLPHADQKATEEPAKKTGDLPTGSETILLAEDDDAVRILTAKILKQGGYQVIEARTGKEAVEKFRENRGKIDLLLLDIIMPQLGGYDAYEIIRQTRPGIKALFASGYSEDAIHTNFVLQESLSLLRKPAGRRDILEKIRSVLDS